MSASQYLETRRERWLLLLCALVLFAAGLTLFTRHNTFPYYYHPDEPGKTEQVLTGRWNFNHPMLMLTSARVVVEAGGLPRAEQPVVVAGRWVSAAFASGAVVVLALLVYAWRGRAAALATGLALLCHHQLFELAHYFKEDTALLAGLALTFLMIFATWWRPSPWRVALLGVACGLAISGKYIGVIALGLALPILWLSPGRNGARFAIFGGALVATLLLVNLPLLLQLGTFRQSLGREMDFVVHGQRGLTRSVPHAQYWNVFIDNTTPALWLLLLVFLRARWHDRKLLTLPEWMLIVFPFAYALALSFSPKSNDRYFLPATAIFTTLAAIGTVDLARMFAWRRTRRRWLVGSITALVLAQIFSLPRPLDWGSLREYWRAFQVDDNADLLAWVRTKLPPTAVIAKDNRILLPDPAKKRDVKRLGTLPQKVLGARFAADLGTLEELRAQGVTHVAVSQSDYGRFMLDGLRPQEGEGADFHRRKDFYLRLARDTEGDVDLVFERDRGTVIYLHPGIRIYRLVRE